MSLIKRLLKGQALTAAEHDANLDYLNDRPDGQTYPKTKGVGIKLDTAAPVFGWKDLIGAPVNTGVVNSPAYVAYQGNIKQREWELNDEREIEYHLPHDYAPGTDLFIHVHWSHNSSSVVSGGTTWLFELMYAKGHNQAFFSTPITVQVQQDASNVRYQHMVAEVQCSATLGAGGLLPTEDIETDGIIIARVQLIGNDISAATNVFEHSIDIHYQSTGLPTKNKAPDFWT